MQPQRPPRVTEALRPTKTTQSDLQRLLDAQETASLCDSLRLAIAESINRNIEAGGSVEAGEFEWVPRAKMARMRLEVI